MLTDQRIAKLAERLVDHSIRARRGDVVVIDGDVTSLPLIRACHATILNRGAIPLVEINDSALSRQMLAFGQPYQANYIDPTREAQYRRANCWITIWGEANTQYLHGVPTHALAGQRAAHRGLGDLWAELTAEDGGTIRWVGTQFPGDSAAQDAGMSTDEFERLLFNACLATDYTSMEAHQTELCKWLSQFREFEINAKGVHLCLKVGADKKWMSDHGRCNMPGGEVYTAPDEHGIDGHIYFNLPSTYDGNRVEGVQLNFCDGYIESAKARVGHEFLLATLDQDEGSRRIGEFAFGLNYNIDKWTGNILFDEKIGGSFHLAVGDAYKDCNGINNSVIHWDMTHDLRRDPDAEVLADGKLIYAFGKFLAPETVS